MRTTLLVAGLATLSLAAPAFAGGVGDPAPAPAPTIVPAPMPVATTDWSGFYAGGSLGYGDVTGSATLGDDVNGATYGVFGGYLYDLGNYIVGGELEIEGSNITDTVSGLDVDSVARLKFRAGYDAGQWLPYVTAGAAQLTTSGAIDDSDTGAFYGVGADYQVSDRMRVGAEVLQHNFDDFAGSGIDVDATTLAARVSFQF